MIAHLNMPIVGSSSPDHRIIIMIQKPMIMIVIAHNPHNTDVDPPGRVQRSSPRRGRTLRSVRHCLWETSADAISGSWS